MYRRGTQLDSLQFALSMATLQSGSTLLSEQELDILTARCGIIMLTLHEIGCATYEQVNTTGTPWMSAHWSSTQPQIKYTTSFENTVPGIPAFNKTDL